MTRLFTAGARADAPGENGENGELERARRLALDALVDHFAHDQLRPEEFERRVAAARGAGSLTELRALLADLPGGSGEEGLG